MGVAEAQEHEECSVGDGYAAAEYKRRQVRGGGPQWLERMIEKKSVGVTVPISIPRRADSADYGKVAKISDPAETALTFDQSSSHPVHVE